MRKQVHNSNNSTNNNNTNKKNDYSFLKNRISHQEAILDQQLKAKQQFGFGYNAERSDVNDYTKFHMQKPHIFDDRVKREVAETFNEKVHLDTVNTKEYDSYSFVDKMGIARNQRHIGACVDFRKSDLIEYFVRETHGEEVMISPLYGYKKTRDLAYQKGDVGTTIRTGMKQLVTYGWIPEKDYPYIPEKYDDTIDPMLMDLGKLNQATSYVRVDYNGIEAEELINEIKKNVIREIPVAFGVSIYESINQANDNGGMIPYPATDETQLGGHALTICGFDNDAIVVNLNGNIKTRGGFIVKNSWSEKWGHNGFGVLPYEFIRDELALDFWTLIDMEFLNLRDFD